MHPFVRNIVGGVIGIIVLVLIVAAVDFIEFPLPPGTELTDSVVMKAETAHLPSGGKVLMLVGWFLGPLLGSFLATKISRSATLGVSVGTLLLTFAVLDLLRSFPHAAWMWTGEIVSYIAATWFGVQRGVPKDGAAAPAAAAQV
jgi:hypothetical protein